VITPSVYIGGEYRELRTVPEKTLTDPSEFPPERLERVARRCGAPLPDGSACPTWTLGRRCSRCRGNAE
jgi:hypothetical protein